MTINLYPAIVQESDLTPPAFGADIEDSCNEIYQACKGWGADYKKVIAELATKDATVRYKLAWRYKELYEGKALSELMRKEFSGNFGTAMEFLAMPSDEAECAMIYKACKGIGANINVVYSICCGRTNEEIDRLKKTYFKVYTKDLGKLLASELHGNMERLVFNCLQGGEEEFDPQHHTKDQALTDAVEIYECGQGRWFTDEKGIFKVLCKSPPEHIRMVNDAYAEKYGYSLQKAMEKELSGNLKEAAMFTVGMKMKPHETIAQLIKTACAGIGTDELLLTCCIIRYQGIMKDVMAAHVELFGKTVHDRVRSECSGKYKEVLLETLNTAWPEA